MAVSIYFTFLITRHAAPQCKYSNNHSLWRTSERLQWRAESGSSVGREAGRVNERYLKLRYLLNVVKPANESTASFTGGITWKYQSDVKVTETVSQSVFQCRTGNSTGTHSFRLQNHRSCITSGSKLAPVSLLLCFTASSWWWHKGRKTQLQFSFSVTPEQ